MRDYEHLKRELAAMGGVVICYSGGVDSTLLAKAAVDALGERAVCVMAQSCLNPGYEIDKAVELARELDLNLVLLRADPLSIEEVARNEPDRCYHCKLALFGRVAEIARQQGIEHVLDGANADDASDYRPGADAARELGVRSPLEELGWTKARIREVSRRLGLPTWNQPSRACLASRVPYGTRITHELLNRIEKAEAALRALGFTQLRVRHCGDTARIELMPSEMDKILGPGVRERVTRELLALGYTYVTLDLIGYRTGSLNEALARNQQRSAVRRERGLSNWT